MHKLQAIAEIRRMYADPYTLAVTRSQQFAAGITGLSLFVSVAVFVACALPVLAGILGPEVAVAPLTKTALYLTAVEHKIWIISISGLLLLLAALTVWNARYPRTLDPEITRQCRRVRRLNRWMLRISAGLWLVGILSVYLALLVSMVLK